MCKFELIFLSFFSLSSAQQENFPTLHRAMASPQRMMEEPKFPQFVYTGRAAIGQGLDNGTIVKVCSLPNMMILHIIKFRNVLQLDINFIESMTKLLLTLVHFILSRY